jgi:putative RNA ligase
VHPKFFNVSETSDEELEKLAGEPAEVWSKEDGSLGLIHYAGGELAVATRGSFASEQAIHATELLRAKYPNWRPPAGVSVMVEIVYPANRIVVRYDDEFNDLILLSGVDMVSGRTVPFDDLRAAWPGPAVQRFPFTSLAEALAAPELPNREGYVIRFTDSDVRVKSKFTDYIRLHRLVTGVTARTVWEHAGVVDLASTGVDTRRIGQTMQMDKVEAERILAASPGGDWRAPFLEAVPEEFADWVKATAARVEAEVDDWERAHTAAFASLGVSTADRRAAAGVITRLSKAQQGAMFALLDGKSIRSMAWRATRPSHETPFAVDEEAV